MEEQRLETLNLQPSSKLVFWNVRISVCSAPNVVIFSLSDQRYATHCVYLSFVRQISFPFLICDCTLQIHLTPCTSLLLVCSYRQSCLERHRFLRNKPKAKILFALCLDSVKLWMAGMLDSQGIRVWSTLASWFLPIVIVMLWIDRLANNFLLLYVVHRMCIGEIRRLIVPSSMGKMCPLCTDTDTSPHSVNTSWESFQVRQCKLQHFVLSSCMLKYIDPRYTRYRVHSYFAVECFMNDERISTSFPKIYRNYARAKNLYTLPLV